MKMEKFVTVGGETLAGYPERLDMLESPILGIFKALVDKPLSKLI